MKSRRVRKIDDRLIQIIAACIITTVPLLFIGLSLAVIDATTPRPVISPVPDDILDGVSVTATPTPTPAPVPVKKYRGKASYYSVNGCIGCSATRTMADGSRLDDNRLTLAYNHVKLGTVVQVHNVQTGLFVYATVTDRGGFERHGKIADLSVATKEAIKCGDVCDIELSF